MFMRTTCRWCRLGDTADVQLNAYPDRTFHGRISNIGKVLDPNIRTAKVRIELANPGMMRAGMFVTATFYGQHGRTYATVPSGRGSASARSRLGIRADRTRTIPQNRSYRRQDRRMEQQDISIGPLARAASGQRCPRAQRGK